MQEAGSDGSSSGTASGPSTGATTDVPADTSTGTAPLVCNGHAELCARRVDEVTFASTHNSMAATDAGFSTINANQRFGIRRQLDDGIRGMLLDVYEEDGARVLCHGRCSLGKIPHIDALAELGGFLDEHPTETVVIIYEDHASAEGIAQDWQDSGYAAMLFTKRGGLWPTLEELVSAGTRVIVTAENGGPPPAWFHHVWDLAWDTPYTFHSLDELSCALNRGSTDNELFLVNHWISNELDLPDASAAAGANAAAVLQTRADDCAAEWSHPVNLLAVDFYDEGDLLAVVDVLNGV